jgi:hypothetical protein
LCGIIPYFTGKKHGISPIQPFFVTVSPENICEFSSLQMNSLRDCATKQGINSRQQGISSALWTGTGNWLKIDPLAAMKHLFRAAA